MDGTAIYSMVLMGNKVPTQDGLQEPSSW